jgi:hypothetical protein
MGKLKSLGAYTWAVLATPIVLATFLGISFFSRALAVGTGVKISPWYLGGDVVREIDHGGYRTVLRRPVFEGLIGQRSTGFVQVEWFPAEGTSLPGLVREGIDYDSDGSADFTVELDTVANRATVAAHSPRVLGLEHVYKTSPERVVRVALRRQ